MPDGAWWVVQTEPQRERLVEAHLQQDGYSPYLPRIQAHRSTRIAPLFPGYIFVAACPSWYPIRATRGVRNLLMTAEAKPARLPHAVISEIRSRERNGLIRLPPAPRYRRGQRVEIMRGPFETKTAFTSAWAAGNVSGC